MSDESNGKNKIPFDDKIDWWPMHQHDPSNSGYSTSEAPNSNNILWTFKQQEPLLYSSPIIDNSRLYVGFGDNIYCLNAEKGIELWNFATGDRICHSQAVVNGMLYIGSDDHNIYCLNAETGEKIWNYTTEDLVWVWCYIIVAEGKVFVGPLNGKMYCLDAITGKEIWTFKTGDGRWSSPAVAYGKVYFNSYSILYCLDANNGKMIWHFPVENSTGNTPTVFEGKVFFGTSRRDLARDFRAYCLDAGTGEEIWNFPLEFDMWSSPSIAYGNVYVIQDRFKIGNHGFPKFNPLFDNLNIFNNIYKRPIAKMYCLDLETGKELWNFSSLNDFGPYSIADGKIFSSTSWFGTSAGIICLNAYNGSQIWNFSTEYYAVSTPAICCGKVYVGAGDTISKNGTVYCFGDPPAPPKFEIGDFIADLGSISTEIGNVGNTTAEGVNCSLSIKGGILQYIHINTIEHFGDIDPSEMVSVFSDQFIFGLGKINIHITVNAVNAESASKQVQGFVLGPLIFIDRGQNQ